MTATRSAAFALGLATACALAAGALPALANTQVQGPKAVIQLTVDQALSILSQEELSSEERRARLEKLVLQRFDFRTMSRLVLARGWKKFTPEQQEQFVTEYRTYLANTYSGRLDRYSGEQIEVMGERQEPRGDVTVMTKIVGGEFDGALVDYRLRSRGGPWLVIDVIVEGISLVSNYRDQFREVLSNGGPEHVLEKLREKNANGEVEDIDAA